MARKAKEKAQNLSLIEEDTLINWILNEEIASRAPTKQNTRAFAQLIANQATKP